MAIEQIEWAETFLEPHRDADLEASLTKANGGELPPNTRFLSQCPWLARVPAHFNWFNQGLAHIDIDLAEKLSLVVSQDNSCRFCFAAHRTLMRILGTPEDRIRRLEMDMLTVDLAGPEQAAMAFARRLSRSSPILTSADLEPLTEAGWSNEAIREMALVCGAMIAANRYSTFLALDPKPFEAFPDRWYIRPIIPILGLLLRAKTRRGQPTPFTDAERKGPFARVINAFDGLPLGHSLRTVIDEAWAFDAISHSTKALIAAVIARGIGDQRILAEARGLALASGVTDSVFDDVMAHLSAADLTQRDRMAIEFARESIRFQPAQLQRRTRELVEHFDQRELLDLVGFASIANVIARFGVFVGDA